MFHPPGQLSRPPGQLSRHPEHPLLPLKEEKFNRGPLTPRLDRFSAARMDVLRSVKSEANKYSTGQVLLKVLFSNKYIIQSKEEKMISQKESHSEVRRSQTTDRWHSCHHPWILWFVLMVMAPLLFNGCGANNQQTDVQDSQTQNDTLLNDGALPTDIVDATQLSDLSPKDTFHIKDIIRDRTSTDAPPFDIEKDSASGDVPVNVDMPYYFIAVHNEPSPLETKVAKSFGILKTIVAKADSYNIKLTLMFGYSWADYIAKDTERMNTLNSWKTNGHEIALHHHSPYHGSPDGYTFYSEIEAKAIIEKSGNDPSTFTYRGTLDDMMQKLYQINPEMNSGCANDSSDKNELPDAIIYDTCSGYVNYGSEWLYQSDANPMRGLNEFVMTGTVKEIGRKWLSHQNMSSTDLFEQAKIDFDKAPPTTVYGLIAHSSEAESTIFLAFFEFIHAKDPTGSRSRTITELIKSGFLPEKELPQSEIEKIHEHD